MATGTGREQRIEWKPSHPAFEALIAALLEEGAPIYVVGGVVRDYVLGRPARTTDLDLAVFENAIDRSRRVANRLGWAFYAMDEGHDVGRLVFPSTGADALVCDIASLRGRSLETDLRSRDFTINAMAFRLQGKNTISLIDVVDGQQDLAAALVRRTSQTSLADDPARLLRAVRFAAQLQFDIEQETEEQIRRMADTVRLASEERIRDELWKMLATADGEKAIDDARRLGLLRFVLPEVSALVGVSQSAPHRLDVYHHTLETMRYATQIRQWLQADRGVAESGAAYGWLSALLPWHSQLRRQFMRVLGSGRTRAEWLVWHALLHDIGKPATQEKEVGAEGAIRFRFFDHDSVGATMAEERLTALRFSRHEIDLSRNVVRAHMRPHHLRNSFVEQPVNHRSLFRLVRDCGGSVDEPAAVDVALLALADARAIFQAEPERLADYQLLVGQIVSYAYDDHGQSDVRRRPLVDGHTLMEHLEIEPGPAVGKLMAELHEAQAAGDIETEDQALTLAERLWPTVVASESD